MERLQSVFRETSAVQSNLHSLISRLAQPDIRHNILFHLWLPDANLRILLIKNFRALFKLALYTHAWYCILRTWGRLLQWTIYLRQ